MTFHLRDGASVTGKVVEVESDYIAIAGYGRRTIIRTISIDWWELSMVSPDLAKTVVVSLESKDAGLDPLAQSSDSSQIKTEVEIDARFGQALAAAKISIEPPNFSLHEREYPSRGQERFRINWERIQQKYKHAERIGELHPKFGRIQSIVSDLFQLDQEFPGVSEIKRHMAYCQHLCEVPSVPHSGPTTGGVKSKAILLFEMIARDFDEPRDWSNLAAAAQVHERWEIVAKALVSFFKHVSPASEMDKWFVLINSLLKTAPISSLAPLTSGVPMQEADCRLIVESSIYLLKKFEKKEVSSLLLRGLVSNRNLSQLSKEGIDELLKLPSLLCSSSLVDPIPPATIVALPVPPTRSVITSTPRNSPQPTTATKVGSMSISAFRQAKSADQRGDLKLAEMLYRQEIERQGPQRQSAIKDLAWTILPRVGKVDEAIELLQKHRAEFADKQPVDQLLAQLCLKGKKYNEAAAIFHRLRGTALTSKRPLLKRQEAYSLFAAGDFAGALRLLEELRRESPFDTTTLSLIERIKQAQESTHGTGTTIEEHLTLDLASFSSGLSQFAEFILAGCTLQEVGDEAKARGFFVEKDFSRIEDRYDRLRGRVPQAKAQLLLTLAALCRQSPEAAGERDMHDFLRRALAFMGEAAINDKLHRDTARCYLTESLHIVASEQHRWSSDLPITYLLATYLTTIPGPGALLDRAGNPSLEVVLRKFLGDPSAWQAFADDFRYYATMAPAVVLRLQRELPRINGLKNILPKLKELEQVRHEENDRFQNEIACLAPFARQPCTASNLHETAVGLRGLAKETRFEFDQQRITRLADFAEHAAAYWLELDYVARENKFRLVESNLSSFLREINDSPTKLAVEALRPIADRVLGEITRDWHEYSSKAKPIVELSNVLVDDYYISKEQIIAVALEVASKRGGAPIENIQLFVAEEGGLQVLDSVQLPAVLRGGDRQNLQIKLKLGKDQVEDQAFTLRARLRYRTSRGDEEETPEYTLPIRLGRSFEKIDPNPYERYAGGKEIDNPDMFFGRKELLQRIIHQVTKGPVGQCFVLYGQKRSGKTSVLRQVARELTLPVLCAEITLGAIDTKDPEYSFNQECVDALQAKLYALGIEVKDWPTQTEVQARPLDGLRGALRKTVEAVSSLNLSGDPRVVFLIDEFTYVYDYIREGIITSQFMRQWKALLQLGVFSAVVVGQDSMKQFKEEYANEFGSTKDEKLNYLSDPEAVKLATDPTRLNGQSRYRGKAIDRLLKMTAGSPFYMQILCSALVDHLNEVEAPFVTEADLNIVIGKLVGKDALSIDKFDPLIAAAGDVAGSRVRDEILYLLTAIAHSSNAAQISQLPPISDRDRVLHDMIDRQIVTVDAAGLVSIRVGLFAEWLRLNRTFRE